MIDVGLLLSIVVAVGAPSLVARRIGPMTYGERSVLDVTLPALGVGVLAGRLVAVAMDDPGALGQLRDLAVVRSGVEFWPGVMAAMVWLAVGAWREGVRPDARLADLAPYALIGYAGYEATCLVRQGCFGPVSSVGLRPDGLSVSMIPMGILAALVIGAVGALLLWKRPVGEAWFVIVGAVGTVAIVRSVVSFWLPALGDGLTRQHRTSVVVAVLAASVMAAALARTLADRGATAPAGGEVR